jgi:hypothetical protein
MKRREFVGLALAACLLAPHIVLASQAIQVMKTSSCGCCIGWIKHLESNGFSVRSRDVPMATLMQEKAAAGLRPELTSCHTARIGSYVVEGHVPAREVKRLLKERPDAIGLAVPDMPLGSPGMEAAEKEPYDVLLVHRDGSTTIFASYR